MPSSCEQDAGRVIGQIIRPILVPARRQMPVGESMSLYRARLGLAPYVPLGVAMPSFEGGRVRRCEPRVHSTLTGRGDRC